MTPPRMILKFYICESGKVTQVNDLGTSTLAQIFTRRPDSCQYAVVVVPDTPEDQIWVLDLYDLRQMDSPHGPLSVGVKWTYSDLNTAVAATLLRLP